MSNDNNNNGLNAKIEKLTEFDKIMSECKEKLNSLDTHFKDVTSAINEMHHFVLNEKQQHEKIKAEVAFYKLDGLVALFECKMDSLILTKSQVKELNDLCEFETNSKLELLYRGSRDGFGSDAFHRLCDGIKNTLTIVKTTNDYIFGGFTYAEWDVSDDDYKKDDKSAFIFTLINNENRPLKLNCTLPKNAICCESDYGPTFGCFDFSIAPNSNSNNNSYSKLGHSYGKGDQSPTLLAGANKFQMKEIEVFQKL